MSETRAAICFGAKSTIDEKGSIATHLADGRALAEAEGYEVMAKLKDENRSAYHGNRGPQLERALTECERPAREHGSCALIVQHSDRLARGDGRGSKHLLHYALSALEHNVKILSVQDPQTFGICSIRRSPGGGTMRTPAARRRRSVMV